MRVVQLGPYPPPHGGVQTNLVAIREYIRARGVECAVINVTRHRRANADEVYYPKTALGLMWHLFRHRYDVVHLHVGGILPLRVIALAFVCTAVPWAPGASPGTLGASTGLKAGLTSTRPMSTSGVRPVIGATGRTVMQPFQLGEWLLPPGTRVVTEISLVQRDERFHRNAHRFDPDRFVGRKPDTYAWIPFGGGVRRCVGAAFAQFEMDVVLRTLLGHFELQPTDAQGERESFRGVAFAPAKGGIAAVRRRPEPLREASAPAEASAAECPVNHGRRHAPVAV